MSSHTVLHNKRGISTIVAVVFFVAIATVIFFGTYLDLSRTMVAMSEYDRQKASERFKITRVGATIDDFTIEVQNDGDEDMRLVAVWFLKLDDQTRYSISNGLYLTPKTSVEFSKSSLVGEPTIPFEDYDSVKVVSERGNVVVAPLPYTAAGGEYIYPVTITDAYVRIKTHHIPASLNFSATNTLEIPITVGYLFVDLIDPTGARKGAVYIINETIEAGQTITIDISDLEEPDFGARIGPSTDDRLILSLVNPNGQVVGHAIAIA